MVMVAKQQITRLTASGMSQVLLRRLFPNRKKKCFCFDASILKFRIFATHDATHMFYRFVVRENKHEFPENEIRNMA